MLHLNTFTDYLALYLILALVPSLAMIAVGTWANSRREDMLEKGQQIAQAAFWACVLLWAVRRLFF